MIFNRFMIISEIFEIRIEAIVYKFELSQK